MRLNQTWTSAIGDFTLEIEAETVHEIEALLELAKETNLVQLQVEAISKLKKIKEPDLDE